MNAKLKITSRGIVTNFFDSMNTHCEGTVTGIVSNSFRFQEHQVLRNSDRNCIKLLLIFNEGYIYFRPISIFLRQNHKGYLSIPIFTALCILISFHCRRWYYFGNPVKYFSTCWNVNKATERTNHIQILVHHANKGVFFYLKKSGLEFKDLQSR